MEGSQENGVKKGPWSIEEDQKLIDCIKKHGQGNWQTIPKEAGLNRCGKSCRLRWTNYLKPGIKRGGFSDEEEAIIISLHKKLGNKWSRIAAHLPRRTDNEIKNHWNTHLRKKLLRMGIDPKTHRPIPPDLSALSLSHHQAQLLTASNLYNNYMNPLDAALSLQANAHDLIKLQIVQNMLQLVNPIPLDPYIQGNANLGDDLLQFNRFSSGTNNDFTVDPLQAAHSSMMSDMSNISALLNQQLSSTSNSFPWFEGETIPAGPFTNDNVKGSTSNNTYNSEYSLPSLVSISPENSTVNRQKSIQQSYITTERPDQQINNVFGAWENLVDDEANSSFWKNILG